MTSTPNDRELVIKEGECFSVGDISVKAIASLGLLASGVHYFKVELQNEDGKDKKQQFGLLRIGLIAGCLDRELKLRESLGDYALVSQLLSHAEAESVSINPPDPVKKQPEEESSPPETENIAEEQEDSEADITQQNELEVVEKVKIADFEVTIQVSTENPVPELQSNSDTLEEEYYEEVDYQEIEGNSDGSKAKLLLLTAFPSEEDTLETWLQTQHSKEEYLSVIIQVCQFSSYLFQRQRYLINLLPEFIQIDRPLKFGDLSTVYSLENPPQSGLIGDYCAPELAAGEELQEKTVSYAIAALLYQCSHNRLLPSAENLNLKIDPIPRIYQLLRIGLSPVVEERFDISQLLSLLVETRNLFRAKKIQWQVASHSTVGLSTSRLTNEDNYGVRQQRLSDSETLIMGVVADGMGGMAQGEVASEIAVKTLLKEPIPQDFKSSNSKANWLLELFQKANQAITNDVKDGGTTLSAVLGICDRLMVAHVGDSRIYLIRQGKISQLSEDHSMVAMMVASGQITQEQSLEHPDRNVLTKSLGSKRILPKGYVQDLTRTKQELSITLEDGDILLLCSDGVWDLVATEEIKEIFTDFTSLQSAVDTTIERVLERGASDNATLLALRCCIEKGN